MGSNVFTSPLQDGLQSQNRPCRMDRNPLPTELISRNTMGSRNPNPRANQHPGGYWVLVWRNLQTNTQRLPVWC